MKNGLTRLGPARRRLSRGEWKAEQAQAKFFANAKAVAKVGLKKGYKEGIEKAKAEGQEIIAQAQEQAKAIGAKVGGVFAGLADRWHKPSAQARAEAQKLKDEADRAFAEAEKEKKKAEGTKSRLRSGLIRGWPLLATCSQKKSPRPKNLGKSWAKSRKKPRSLPGLFSGMRKNLARLQTLQPSSKSEGLDFFVKLGINKI